MQQGIDVDLPKTSASGVEMNEEPFVLVIGPDQKMTVAKTKIAMNELRPKLKAIF